MDNKGFFDETQEQSIVKATIVSKYLGAWAKVIIPSVKKQSGRIAYLDLFAGPGRYRDDTKSTPLLVLETAIKDSDLRQMLVTVFNDKDQNHCQELENAIKELPGIQKLKYYPKVMNEDVGTEMVKSFEGMKLIPTLFFVDPWGYKGLSLQLVNAVVKDWASECIFFFNFNRINMGLTNEYVEEHMNALFGKENADTLRCEIGGRSPHDRELRIVEELCKSLNPTNRRFVLPFRFKNENGSRTSHHLIFVSKNFRGYHIMKGIMSRESSNKQQGVATFEYNPADKRYPLLFDLARPLEDLEELLLEQFAGKKITFKKLYETHSVGRSYIDSNYKAVLRQLEEDGRLTADKSGQSRRKGTFADDVVITFGVKER